MARRERNRLSATKVRTVSTPGRYADGGGLYLVVDPSAARRWLFNFRWQGKRPEMGLGGFPVVSLAEARKKAEEAERQVRSGTNALAIKQAQRQQKAQEPTFGDVCDQAIPVLTRGYKNQTHAK